jgi:hypothetical protein
MRCLPLHKNNWKLGAARDVLNCLRAAHRLLAGNRIAHGAAPVLRFAHDNCGMIDDTIYHPILRELYFQLAVRTQPRSLFIWENRPQDFIASLFAL